MLLVFTDYPEEVVRHVCDPRGGLASKQNFLPTVYEIRQACDWWMKLHEPSRPRLAKPSASSPTRFNDRPTVLPYMPGQPDDLRADPRAGLTFAELRARGYSEEQIQAPRAKAGHCAADL